jgi:hypothetical protein
MMPLDTSGLRHVQTLKRVGNGLRRGRAGARLAAVVARSTTIHADDCIRPHESFDKLD